MKATPTNIALILIVGAVLLYAVALSPLRQSLADARKELAEEKLHLHNMLDDIAKSDDLQKQLDGLRKASSERKANLIEPMLNSYAMRAKSLLGKIADECGLEDVVYGEGPGRQLPVPEGQTPAAPTVRRAVVVRASGDYAAIASFILRIEHDLPLVTVQAISIRQEKSKNLEIQDAEIVLEWPGAGEVPK